MPRFCTCGSCPAATCSTPTRTASTGCCRRPRLRGQRAWQPEQRNRTEHYHDQAEAKANTIVVAVTVFVRDDQDRVLLLRRADNGLWALPGGGQEIGESIAETATRETAE